MSTSADPRPPRPDRNPVTGVLACSAAVGLLAVGLVLGLDRGHGRVEVALEGMPHTLLLAVLLVLSVAAELASVRLRSGEASEDLTLLGAALVGDALLLRPREALAVAVLAHLVASLAARRTLTRTVFEAGTGTVGGAVLIGSVALLANTTDDATPFGAGTVAGIALGAAGAGVVRLLSQAGLHRLLSRVPLRGTLRQGWRVAGISAVGTAAVGTTTVAVAASAPLLLPFTLLPAGALTFAYTAIAHEGDQRRRSQQLLALGHLLAGPVQVEDLITSFLAYVREAFRAQSAFMVLEAAGREETVVVAHELGVDVRPASPQERLLLATSEVTGLLPEVVLPEGARRVLASPLDAENRRLGLLALTEPVPPRSLLARLVDPHARHCALGSAEVNLIGPLAAALAAALRGAEHLTHSRDETAKLRAVIRDSSDGIVVLDADARVDVWNPSMTAVTGLSEDDAVGRQLSDLVEAVDPKGNRIDPVGHAWAKLTPEEPHLTFETALQRHDGDQRWVRWSHAAVFEEHLETGEQGLVRDVVLVHDVTRERQVERLKQDFLATVSHELRSPLTPIKGYVDLLRRKGEEFTPDKRRECLDVVNDRVAHLARLVEDVLLASRVTVPASTVQMGSGDLVALARKTIADFAVEASRLHVELPQRPVDVACDPVRVVQVVANLVGNALKYSPSSAPVFVTLRADQGTARLSVTDRGRGIPADQLEAIFEKFHRVEDPMRMTTGGTGLGLYIAQQLTEAMGGQLSVTSAYGVGSTFTFSLPLLPAGQVRDEAAGSTWPTQRFGRPPFPTPRRGSSAPRP